MLYLLSDFSSQTKYIFCLGETLSVEDVRRPVYRGNHRYNFFLPNLNVKERVNGKTLKFFSNMSSNARTISYGEQKFRNESVTNAVSNDVEHLSKEKDKNNIDWRNEHKKMLNTTEDVIAWSQVQLTGSNESTILDNFVENSLHDLEKTENNFKKVILPSVETTTRHMQIYPASSTPSWVERPGVILVEDVHPSKLPKPPSYNQVPLYPRPTKPSVNYDYKPPVSKPGSTYEILESFITKPPNDYNYPKPVVSKPIYPHPDVDTSTKPVDIMYFNPKPMTMKPTFDLNSGLTTHQPISVTVTNVLTHFTPVYTKPPPEPPPRPPPPTIVVIEPPSDNYIDCGNIQVLNSATFKHCPDVTVILNNKQNTSALSPAPDPNVQAAAVIPVSPVSPANGVVPLVSPPIVATPKPPITITVHDIDDEEYDYEDDEVANDVVVSSTTTISPKPSRPSSSTSLLGYLQTLITSLPFIGPISVSLWIIFLGPLSFLLLGAMGVASFIFPWLAPRLVFGRSTSGLYIEKPIIPYAANIFLKNIELGTFDSKKW